MDLFLTIVLAITQVVLAGLGILVSVRPPQHHRHVKLLSGAFLLFAGIGIGVPTWQSRRASDAQKEAASAAQTELKDTRGRLESQIVETRAELASARLELQQAKQELKLRIKESESTIVSRIADSSQAKSWIARKAVKRSPSGPRVGSEDEEALASWGMNDERLQLLAHRMKVFASKDERGDLITAVMGDPDSMRFSSKLAGAFKKAGWKVDGFGQAVFTNFISGVIIKLHSKESEPAGLYTLLALLRQSGIEPVGEIDQQVPEDHFRIIVGSRP